jgi:hypothetical protein
MWYMPMHLAAHELGGSLYCFSLFESICLFYKTSLLAIVPNLWGGGDNRILWLSFAQQTLHVLFIVGRGNNFVARTNRSWMKADV